MTSETNTFRIPVQNLPSFKAKLGKLRETAAQLNVGGDIGYAELLRQRTRHIDEHTLIVHDSEYALVSVYGDAPKFEGWALRGRYDFTAVEGACLFLAVPGHHAPEGLHKVDAGRCDHCKSNRVRNDVFLLQHDDGHYAVVGRSCIKHYLGHVSPARLAAWAELLFDVRESLEGYEKEGPAGPTYYDLMNVLTYASHCIRNAGWKKSGEADSTKGSVCYLLNPPDDDGLLLEERSKVVRAWHEARAKVSTKDREQGAACLSWLTDGLDPDSDYEHALKTLTEGDVGAQALGIAVSAIPAYCRALGIQVLYPSDFRAPKGPSVHVGTLKERREFDLTYWGCNTFNGDYGLTYFHKFTDADGNDLTWATGTYLELSAGDPVRLKATVKAHDEYNGRPQTKITRAKVLAQPEQTGLPL